MSCTSTAACTYWGTPSKPLAWPRRSAGGRGAKVISVDYRLAPEHPYPAAVDDALAAYEALLRGGTAPSDIAFAGESAGGGLAVATLVNARDHGLPLPAAAFVMSPYADLTLAGATMDTKGEVDVLMSRENLPSRVSDYTAGQLTSVFLALCRQPVMHSPTSLQPARRGPTPPKNGSSTSTPGSFPLASEEHSDRRHGEGLSNAHLLGDLAVHLVGHRERRVDHHSEHALGLVVKRRQLGPPIGDRRPLRSR